MSGYYEKTCERCGEWVQVGPTHTHVVRWCGSVIKTGWWVNGWCPACGYLVIEHQVGDDGFAHQLIGEGAMTVLYSRPAEVDDPDHHWLVSPLDDELAADLARAVMDSDEKSLGDELAALVEVYGS